MDELMTDSSLTQAEIDALERLIDSQGIGQVLIALSEICGAKAEHIETTWQDKPLAKRWATLEGALGCAIPFTEGLDHG